MKHQYECIPYSVAFDGEWDDNCADFRAACSADLPTFVLLRMLGDIVSVLHNERRHDELSDPILEQLALLAELLERRASECGDFED